MPVFDVVDHFQLIEGGAPIAIGAPHHGTRPNVAADRGTGPIALALARALDARAVIVSDLRRTVDVNKQPARFSPRVRSHALRYQNELFRDQPRLVIEIHGHVSGQYPIEITTGFELDAASPGDARCLQQLSALKQALPIALSSRLGQTPGVGVWPLDRNVQKTATDTFTFQKIRRARHLIGVEWYGLHIELNAELRTTKQTQSKAFIKALADSLATSIQAAFEPLPALDALIPTQADRADGETTLLLPHTLRVVAAPEKYVGANVIVVNPIDLETLAALDGDAVIARHGLDELRSTITPSLIVRPGQAALPARVRRQINVSERGQIIVGRPGRANGQMAANDQSLFVIHALRAGRDRSIGLSSADIERAGLHPNMTAIVRGPTADQSSEMTVMAEDALPARRATLSRAALDQLVVTVGEVIAVKPAN
jgi:hypothetical protein